MRAKTKEQLKVGDEIVIFLTHKGKRSLNLHTVTELTEDDVIADCFDIGPNEDNHYFVLPKIE